MTPKFIALDPQSQLIDSILVCPTDISKFNMLGQVAYLFYSNSVLIFRIGAANNTQTRNLAVSVVSPLLTPTPRPAQFSSVFT